MKAYAVVVEVVERRHLVIEAESATEALNLAERNEYPAEVVELREHPRSRVLLVTEAVTV